MVRGPRQDDWVSVKEAAELTGLCENTIRNRIWWTKKESPGNPRWQSINHRGRRMILLESIPFKDFLSA